MIPQALRRRLEEGLGAPIERLLPVSGGCINQAAAFAARGRRWFLKWNPSPLPELFALEAHGLGLLRQAGALHVPAPLQWEQAQGQTPAWLLMEHIGPPRQALDRDAFGATFGAALAALHRNTEPQGRYGLDRDNYIGSLPQHNGWMEHWPTFFAQRRLEPQLRLAADNKKLRPAQLKALGRVLDNLERLLPARPEASLLHGDLWSGNYMIGPQGQPVLVDPAVYYGDREVELAFTELFGGFSPSFYRAYEAAWPQADPEGWPLRRALYQAWPLLVHVNLFGGGYPKQLMSSLEPALAALA
jgi:fructosamine-3-kinase